MTTTIPETIKEEGLAAFHAGQLTEALQHFKMAHDNYIRRDNLANAAEMLNNIGVTQRFLQESDAAEKAFKEAITHFQAANDPTREAQALGNLADLYQSKREKERAYGYFLEAAEKLEEVKDYVNLSKTYRAMSQLRLSQFKLREWMTLYHRYLSVKPNPTSFDRMSMIVFAFWTQRAARRS